MDRMEPAGPNQLHASSYEQSLSTPVDGTWGALGVSRWNTRGYR